MATALQFQQRVSEVVKIFGVAVGAGADAEALPVAEGELDDGGHRVEGEVQGLHAPGGRQGRES